MKREHLGSRLGFILLSAGCAIGIGNVWKFPWLVGQNGGGAFVLIYLICMVVLGVPVMTMEFSMGRAAQQSPVKLYQKLEKPGHKWHIHGIACLLGNIILMMMYTPVAGWMLHYFVDTASGKFVGLDPAGISAAFGNMMSDPISMTIYMAIIVAAGFVVCSIGVQKGLERITKWVMSALLIIMVILAINSIFMEGGSEGLAFYLLPNLESVKEIGLGNVIVSAMNQSFFSLSLGIGAMAIFGSYIGKDRALMGESLRVSLLDTFVAVASGLIIFPACFAYGVEPDSGPSLIFKTLPNIFNNIPLGRLWGSLFFVFLTFAAFSTVLAVFENIISCTMELTGWSRKKTCLIDGIAIFILSLPCVLGFSVWSGIQPLGAGSTIMDLEDYIINTILLPLGSLVVAVFCTWRYGWGWDKFMAEANEGKGLKVANWMRWYMAIVVPVIIVAIFLIGIL